MESSYLKEGHTKDSYTPSPLGTSSVLNEVQKQEGGMATSNDDTGIISLEGIKINKRDWERFHSLVMISEEKRRQFLSDMFAGLLKEFLYQNPELFNSYVDRGD